MDAANIFALQPLVALVIGVLILLVPRLLNYFIVRSQCINATLAAGLSAGG